jgi:hypothetical protein
MCFLYLLRKIKNKVFHYFFCLNYSCNILRRTTFKKKFAQNKNSFISLNKDKIFFQIIKYLEDIFIKFFFFGSGSKN